MADPKFQLYELDGYVFDRRTGRYHGPLPSYGMVPQTKILSLIEERIGYHKTQLSALSNLLVDGRLTLAEWMRATAQELKNLHLQQAALAHGGWQNMKNTDFLEVARTLKAQYSFLHQYGLDISLGYPPGRIPWRTGLYAASGRMSFWQAAKNVAKLAGMRWRRRIAKGDKDTCDHCVDLAKLGWVSMDDPMPHPGGPPCRGLTQCRCEEEYR